MVIIAIILCISIIAVVFFATFMVNKYVKTTSYKCFDLKDDELIDILNECDVYATHSPLDTDNLSSAVTTYRIIYNDEIGALFLSHSSNEHIKCIAVAMDDTLYSIAIISAIATILDDDFYSENIISSLLENDIYASDKYSITTIEISSDLTCAFLAPTEHFEDCLNSILEQ